MPALFGRQAAAIEDLEWCLANTYQAPSPGWLREADFHLALLIHNRDASDPRATELLKGSGYASFEKRDFLTTPFAVNAENNRDEIENMLNAPRAGRFFFGERFSMDAIRSYRPDVVVSKTTTVTIGGTEVRLIPVGGGETLDALFIFLPASRVLFVGDFIMPYFGAPFLEEGNLDGLFAAIDTVQALAPTHMLHGHETLTRVFTPPVTAQVKRQLEWLRAEVRTLIRAGTPRNEIHRRNLVPPFIAEMPDAQLAYLVVRENFINRLFDQSTGYWQPGLVGLDHLAPQDIGYAYARYFGLSDSALVAAVDKMLEHGDLELAARTIEEARLAFPTSEPVRNTRVRAYERLREKYQEFNPFKFFIYSEQIGRETTQMP